MGAKKVYNWFAQYSLIIKAVFALGLSVCVCITYNAWERLPIFVLEIFVIIIVSQFIQKKVSVLGFVIHYVLFFIFVAQLFVMYFGSTFITTTMLDNIGLVEDLKGNFGRYLMLLIPAIIIIALPPVGKSNNKNFLLLILITGWAIGLVFFHKYSPLVNALVLVKDEYNLQLMKRKLRSGGISPDSNLYFNAEIGDYIEKPEQLSDFPNIILLFCEGLSQSIVEDDRAIMPNLLALEKNSICFENYFNHTFATYRGLSGQLYSGYQLEDHDMNPLTSLQSILKDKGYNTRLINPEPYQEDFALFLEQFGFDDVYSDLNRTIEYRDLKYIPDSVAIDILCEQAELLSKETAPFFLTLYTFGTHASLDGIDNKFQDGTNPELNKFFDLDCQIVKMLNRLSEDGLLDDTVIVITADHATYVDQSFLHTFPEYERKHAELDRIPLIILYDGVQPMNIDVSGANSLALAPTVLDFVDISAPNFFLGDSLFCDLETEDCYFYDGSTERIAKADPEVQYVFDDERERFLDYLVDYFSLFNSEVDSLVEPYLIELHFNKETEELNVSVANNDEPVSEVMVAVWNDQDGQNDLKWYHADLDGDNWKAIVDLKAHDHGGLYQVHVYSAVDGKPEKFMNGTQFIPAYADN